jgi:FkbM family methyltransferase
VRTGLVATLRHRRLLRNMAGPRLLRAFAGRYPEAFFVEVGSNDGEQHDHLRPLIHAHAWRGIMVEPVPYVFERLRDGYAGLDRVILENSAIADRDGRLPFFHLAEAGDGEELPRWYDGIGSFSRDNVLAHGRHIDGIAARLVETEVSCLTFDSLLRKHGVERVDLLLVDTEGYDWELLRAIDLETWMPRLVVYEHYHLSRDDRAACRAHLERLGYEAMEEGFDTFCLDTRLADRLTAQWRRLSPAVPGVAAYEEAR